MRDSVYHYVHDSIIERYYYGVPDATCKGCVGESGDTGRLDGSGGTSPCVPVVERDRWHTRYRDRIIETCDTIAIVQRDSIPYPVEVPIEVEKPVPRFYRHSTLAFWFLFLALLAYLALRLVLRLYLRR